MYYEVVKLNSYMCLGNYAEMQVNPVLQLLLPESLLIFSWTCTVYDAPEKSIKENNKEIKSSVVS